MRKVAIFTVMLTILIVAPLETTLYEASSISSERVEILTNDKEATASFLPQNP